MIRIRIAAASCSFFFTKVSDPIFDLESKGNQDKQVGLGCAHLSI